MPIDERLIQAALDAGAAKAAVIPGGRVVLSSEFRDICRSNACGKYGSCYMCPPDVGEIEGLMDKVRAYPRALLYQSISPLEDSFDFEGMEAAGQSHVGLSQRLEAELKALLPPGYLHLSCGGCRLCDTCLKPEGLPCRYPDEAMASVESYGVDVYNTVKDTELKYINGQNTVTYFGMAFYHAQEA
ncbi:MAG: DUF2284 domain-containing protein [Eubacteriales bacterium]|nr:DUF2284 domain-containing protein [Eubacteriales bacterium]